MYRLTNLTQDLTTTYKNKDLVYQALERENAKVKHQEAESMLLVEELDKKGVVIYQEDVSLPFEGIADSLFLNKGTTTTPEPPSKKKNFFLKPSKSVTDQEPSLNEKQELREPLSDTEKQSNKRESNHSLLKLLWQGLLLLGLVVSLAIAAFTATLSVKQEKALSNLSQQVKELTSLQSETGKLDTFVRYFLPHYYSEQGELGDFVSSNLELKHPAGQLQSVILESTTKSGDQTYHLTYVLAIKDGETRTPKRLSLTVKAVSSAPYGYQVIKTPKQTAYLK